MWGPLAQGTLTGRIRKGQQTDLDTQAYVIGLIGPYRKETR